MNCLFHIIAISYTLICKNSTTLSEETAHPMYIHSQCVTNIEVSCECIHLSELSAVFIQLDCLDDDI